MKGFSKEHKKIPRHSSSFAGFISSSALLWRSPVPIASGVLARISETHPGQERLQPTVLI